MKRQFSFVLVLALTLGLATTSLSQVTPGVADTKSKLKPKYPAYIQNLFEVEMDGAPVLGVHSIVGLESESDTMESRDAGTNIEHTQLGPKKRNVITITKDWSNTSEFYSWRKTVLDQRPVKKNLSIVLLSEAGLPLARINLLQCLPVKWVGPSFDAKSSERVIETLTLTWESIDVKNG